MGKTIPVATDRRSGKNRRTDSSERPRPEIQMTRGFEAVAVGSDYTPDESEFMKALDAYKTASRRPNPTVCEILVVLRSLGYRKTAERGPLPEYKKNLLQRTPPS